MELRILEESEIDQRTDQSIKDGLCTCFPADVELYSKTRSWNDYSPFLTIVLEEENRVIAHAAVIEKEIRVGIIPIHIAGIMNVFVFPGYRKRGLSIMVIKAAMNEVGRRGFEIGLLFCKKRLERVYRRSGWKTLMNRNITRTVKGEKHPIRKNIIAMYYPLQLRYFPPGDVDLRGNEW